MLLRYNNFPYIWIEQRDHFGLMDIVLADEVSKIKQEELTVENSEVGNNFGLHLRKFSVQAIN